MKLKMLAPQLELFQTLTITNSRWCLLSSKAAAYVLKCQVEEEERAAMNNLANKRFRIASAKVNLDRVQKRWSGLGVSSSSFRSGESLNVILSCTIELS